MLVSAVIRYELIEAPFEPLLVEQLAELMRACFGELPSDTFAARVREKPKAVVALATTGGGTPVGFKLGYARDRDTFYSWLGGVAPDHRRAGIASELMRRQHAHVFARGYRAITTSTLQDNTAMLIANLRAGFVVHGVALDDRGLKVLLRRSRSASAPA